MGADVAFMHDYSFWGIRSHACHFKGHLRPRSDCFTHLALPRVFFPSPSFVSIKFYFLPQALAAVSLCVITNFTVFVVFAADTVY